MKLNGRQRSLSPEKSDGNVSPWRIRVTLEATQDEENENRGSPARKRLRPSTVTTKVPLKDDRSPLQEKTPARRRGRPRKSDVQALNGSPWPGSPGNTPGPKGVTPQKGKRGRPRKGTPKPKAQEIPVAEEEPTPAPEPEPAPAPAQVLDTDSHFSPMDTAADGGGDPARQWSPVNLRADGLDSDSLNADDLPVANLRAPTPAANGEWTFEPSRDFGRDSYGTPVIGATEHHFLDHDANIPSTPSKMPSPNRERSASSARSPRPAENNSSPHTYPPTPTSSLDEEEAHQDGEAQLDNRSENDHQHHQPDSRTDPTNEHEEFDSIMESEGFTMISLDTLPSVKQSLGSSAGIGTDSSSNRGNGRLGGRLKRQLPGGISELRSDNQSSARPSPAALVSGRHNGSERSARQSPTAAFAYPELPATSPEKTRDAPNLGQKLAYPTLAEDEQAEEEDIAESIEAPVDENEGEDDGEDEEYSEDEDEVEVVDPSPRTERIGPAETNPVPLRMQREADWQMEREAVSRQAQDPRNEPRLVYIDSDEDGSPEHARKTGTLEGPAQPHVDSDVDYEDDHLDERPLEEEQGNHALYFEPGEEEPMEEEPVEEEPIRDAQIEEDWAEEPIDEVRYAEPGYVQDPSTTQHANEIQSDAYDDDDDGSVDIWQEEPRYSRQERQYVPQPLSTINESAEMDEEAPDDGFDDIWQQEARDHSRLSESSDDRQPILSEAATNAWRRMAGTSTNPDNWSSSPAYVTMEHIDGKHQKPTHIRKLREEEVDLSAVLAEEDTPNRARYYDGTSTPRSILSRHSGAQRSSINGSAIKSDSSRKAGQRVRLQPISQSSPERESEGEQGSVLSRDSREDSQPEPQPEEIDGDSDGSDVNEHETGSIHTGDVATPEPARQSEEHAPTSTWFQRITSLTPRWLKAPTRAHDDSSSEDESDENDQEDNASIESAKEVREDLKYVPSPSRSSESPRYFDELAGLTRYDRGEEALSEEDDDDEEEEKDEEVQEADDNQPFEQSISDGSVENESVADVNNVVDLTEVEPVKPAGPRPLAAFGYFSDDHYKALRRIYRMAKQYPERFLYHDSPGRAKIIGDWIWTSDGHHGVPITEIQFAIIDRFVHDLSRADVQYGGSGQVDWTEADLHRRLISIIIGEQIREERKAKAARGASVDTWR